MYCEGMRWDVRKRWSYHAPWCLSLSGESSIDPEIARRPSKSDLCTKTATDPISPAGRQPLRTEIRSPATFNLRLAIGVPDSMGIPKERQGNAETYTTSARHRRLACASGAVFCGMSMTSGHQSSQSRSTPGCDLRRSLLPHHSSKRGNKRLASTALPSAASWSLGL